MVKTPVDDSDNPDEDETFLTHTLRTVDVEGVNIVDDGRAVSVNGEFEISLEDEDDEERYSSNKIWANKEEAIEVWEFLTNQQLERAKKLQDKMNHIVNHLQTNLDEKQY
jgi:hypothetical protein